MIMSMGRGIKFMLTYMAVGRKLQFKGLFRGHGSWLSPEQDEWLSDGLIKWCDVCVCVCVWEREREREKERETKTDSTIFYNPISSQKGNLSLLLYAIGHTDKLRYGVGGNYTRVWIGRVWMIGDHLGGWLPKVRILLVCRSDWSWLINMGKDQGY